MKKWLVTGACVLTIMYLPARATAEGLGEASAFLCSSTWAISCAADKVCETGLPTEWNIPQFVVADLEAKTLSTPETSSERRTTPIDLVRSEDGLIFIQGTELGRAFSMVVTEATGELSASITTKDLTIAVFGACTPLPIGR